ncbi:MAG: amidohydrolase family protein [Bacteroidia bacterium]|nr:amidohydrolase family protein [Bacteroidia bacterium]
MKRFVICISVLLCAISCQKNDNPQRKKDAADLVVYGKVFTSENDTPVEAFAVKDGKYVYAGDRKGAEAYIKDGKTEVLDYTGKGLVMPSCGNGHAHYLMAFNTNTIGLSFKEDDTVEKVLAAVKAAAEKPETKVIYGFGWNYHVFNSAGVFNATAVPIIQKLDEICPDIPVYLNDSEGHKGLVNTACLKAAGILDKDGKYSGNGKEIRGGDICLADGKPTGLLQEQAGTYVRFKGLDFSTVLTVETAKKDILASQDKLLKEGYTMYLDGWSNYFNDTAYDALLELEASGELKSNIGLSYEIESWCENLDGEIDKAADYMQKFAGARLAKANWIKLFMDGTVETGTGFCTQPYPDESKGYGIANWEQEEVNGITGKANGLGLSMHIHTMGDAAVKRAVDAFAGFGSKELRNTIVHVRNVDAPDYAKIAANDIYVTSGILWHHFNTILGLLVWMIVPENLSVGSYPIKSFFDNGITVSSSTDYPALANSPDDPFGVMEIAVTGIDGNYAEDELLPWWPEELISREQALKVLTINCAKQMFLDEERGSIKEGKYADFILVDKDVLSCDVNTIHEAKVTATYFEGEKVYP